MARKLVICLDGTGNEIGTNLSNVLKLYRILAKDDEQRVYYNPGVGTIGRPGWWTQVKQQVRGVLGLALGLGLDDNLLDAYSWLCRNWRDGDEIYLFGFSRGAYTARTLAGFIHLCGLLGPDQLNICGYALVAYKNASDAGDRTIGETFRRVSAARRPPIRFVGVWDTVSSVLVPRLKTLGLPTMQKLMFTRRNPSVQCFRHAISIDERRRMFRLNHWVDPQLYEPAGAPKPVDQDIKQVWFAGVHSDVGGGYPDVQSGLAQYPLQWMIGEAVAQGLRIDQGRFDHLAGGAQPTGEGTHPQPKPDPTAQLHKSLQGPWWLLEPVPQRVKEREWPSRWAFLGLYIPWAEPRPIPNRIWKGKPPTEPFRVHRSVVERIDLCADYRPVNLPQRFETEPPGGPQPNVPPPYRPAGALERLKTALTTLPDGKGWLQLLITAAVLAPLLWFCRWMGFEEYRFDLGLSLAVIAAIAFVYPALVEEALFRVILVRPPPNGATALGPIMLSAILFALWHPLQALAWDPPWEAIARDCWFLAACLLLGIGAARLYFRTRSLWPSVLLHWGFITAWAAIAA